MSKIKDIPKIERPREKLEKYGPEKLLDAELLAILLGTGRKGLNVIDLSKRILRKFSKGKLANANVEELKHIYGLGTVKSCEIVACFELGRRMLNNKKAILLLSPKEVWQECRDITKSKKEHFIVFYLNAQSQEIDREIISIGILNESLVHPREVFELAVKNNAAQIIVAHNHPSGDIRPSENDIEITQRLSEAGKILGIELLDHVIVTEKEFLSFKEKKII